jgi:hypothetical protein
VAFFIGIGALLSTTFTGAGSGGSETGGGGFGAAQLVRQPKVKLKDTARQGKNEKRAPSRKPTRYEPAPYLSILRRTGTWYARTARFAVTHAQPEDGDGDA